MESFNENSNQMPMVSKGLKLGHKFYCAYDIKHNDKVIKGYVSFIDKDSYLNHYNRLPEENRIMYEILLPNQKRHNYFDIDVEKEKYPELFKLGVEGVYNMFINDYIKFSCSKLENLRITESSTESKISFHIVDKSIIFNDLQEQKDWISWFKERCEGKVIYDEAVYTSYRNMRLIGCSKINKGSYLKPYRNHLQSKNCKDLKEFFITAEINPNIPFTTTQDYNKSISPVYIPKENIPEYEEKMKGKLIAETCYNIMKEIAETDKDMYEDYNKTFISICVFYNSSKLYGGKRNNWKLYADKFCELSSSNYDEDWVDKKWDEAARYDGRPIHLKSIINKYLLDKSADEKSDFIERYAIGFMYENYSSIPEYEYHSDYNFATFTRQLREGLEKKDLYYLPELLKFLKNNVHRCSVLTFEDGDLAIYRKTNDNSLEYKDMKMKLTHSSGFITKNEANAKGLDLTATLSVEQKMKPHKTNLGEVIENNISYFRTYDALKMIPLPVGTPRENNKAFNTWKGFKCDLFDNPNEVNLKYVDPFLKVLNNACSGNEKMERYILKWFQNLMKKPHVQNETSIVLTGIQGAGKGTILRFPLKFLHDDHCQQLSNLTYVSGYFNGAILEKVYMFIDDTSDYTTNGMKEQDILKSMISDCDQTIRKLYKECKKAKIYINIAISANNPTPIRVENEDRRYVMPEYIKKKVDKKIYKFVDEDIYNNRENLNHLFNYIYHLDLEDVDIRDIPDTELRRGAIDVCKPATYRFYDYMKSEEFKERYLCKCNQEHCCCSGGERPIIKISGKLYIRDADLFQLWNEWRNINMERADKGIKKVKFEAEMIICGLSKKIKRADKNGRSYFCMEDIIYQNV